MNDEKRESVTVGIPTCNGAPYIESALTSVLVQELPEWLDREVIVCANGCTDGTEGIVESFALENDGVELISTGERGRPNAINTIRERAKSDIIVYADDDIRYADFYVIGRLYKDLMDNPGVEVAGGKVVYTYKKSGFPMDGINRIISRPPNRKKLQGAIFAMRTESGLEIPKEVISEDSWLSLSLEDSQLMIDDDAVVYHNLPTSLWDMIKYRYRIQAGVHQLRDDFGLDTMRIKQVRSRLSQVKDSSLGELLLYYPMILGIHIATIVGGGIGYNLGRFDKGYKRCVKP